MTWYRRSKLAWDTVNLSSKLGSKLGMGNSNVVQMRDTLKRIYNNKYTSPLMVVGTTAGIFAACMDLETIPYSKRTHLVYNSSLLEKHLLGRFGYWVEKKRSNWQELPSTHPASMKLKPIADRLIEAAKQGLRDENYDSNYMENFDWEVVVVDGSRDLANSFAAGMIVLDLRLVEYCKSDDELAAIIAGEVSRALARHRIELSGTTALFTTMFYLLLPFKFNNPITSLAAGTIPFMALSRKLYRERSYVGMMLMARAGYDPSAAITLAHKWPIPKSSFRFFSLLPSQKKRLESLGEAQDQAMALYRETLPALN